MKKKRNLKTAWSVHTHIRSDKNEAMAAEGHLSLLFTLLTLSTRSLDLLAIATTPHKSVLGPHIHFMVHKTVTPNLFRHWLNETIIVAIRKYKYLSNMTG